VDWSEPMLLFGDARLHRKGSGPGKKQKQHAFSARIAASVPVRYNISNFINLMHSLCEVSLCCRCWALNWINYSQAPFNDQSEWTMKKLTRNGIDSGNKIRLKNVVLQTFSCKLEICTVFNLDLFESHDPDFGFYPSRILDPTTRTKEDGEKFFVLRVW